MKRLYPYCSDLLKEIKTIKKFFKISYFPVEKEKFSIIKLSSLKFNNKPLLVIMAGCHGEEPAPVIAIFKNYKIFKQMADKAKINLVIYPLINPWGFDNQKRFNKQNINTNRKNWIHYKTKKANEVNAIFSDIKKLKPKIFANLHEDDTTKKEFYIYSFGERKYEKSLIKTGKKYFPIHHNSFIKDENAFLKNGSIYNKHDGSAEDFMFHRGCKFSCCTETSSLQKLSKRIQCNKDLVLTLIKITAK